MAAKDHLSKKKQHNHKGIYFMDLQRGANPANHFKQSEQT